MSLPTLTREYQCRVVVEVEFKDLRLDMPALPDRGLVYGPETLSELIGPINGALR